MSDAEQNADDQPGEKEANKTPSPKPDQDVSPPLISVQKSEETKDTKENAPQEKKKEPTNRRTSVAPQRGQPKKNVILSGEAMKEMQKQAKANRDERRLTMDARHAFLFSNLADALGIDVAQVEEFAVADERFELMEEFFAAKGSRKLLFFYQESVRDNMYSRTEASSTTAANPQKKLFITTGMAEGLCGRCFYFLRPSNEKAVSANSISNDVLFGSIDCTGGKVLEGFQSMMSRIVVPSLKSNESWGPLSDQNNSQVTDFLEQLQQFVGSLEGAKGNMEGRVTLQDNDLDATLDAMLTANDYHAAANNSELVEKLEELLSCWAKQIEQVLAESEQMRREADDIGPAAEVAYWKSRTAKFNNLLEQIKSPRVKAVVGVLLAAKSKSIIHWKELDRKITDQANEAKDNVKYLYTLDKFFGPLTKCNPASMVDHIQSLMNAIRMVYSISRFYNTSERMTSLFVKVTNQMITTCKKYIVDGVSKIWELPRQGLLQRLHDCINLNAEYQKCFQKTKEKLKQNPKERQFEFSENYIFGKFDTFCKRLEKIADMINTMENYAGLPDVRIEGIDAIAVRYKAICDATKKKKVPTATLR